MEVEKLKELLKKTIDNREFQKENGIDYYELVWGKPDRIELFDSVVKCVYDDREGIDKDTQRYVLHFVEHDVYLEVSGWYSSYDGTELDTGTIRQVKPVEKTVTFYESVDSGDESEEDGDESYSY